MPQGLEIQTLTKGQLQHLSNALSGDIKEAFKAYIQKHYCPAFNDVIWNKKPTRGCRRFDFSQINYFAVLLRSFRGVDLGRVEAMALSHGHMDHTGSLYPVLDRLPHRIPLVVHPGVFDAPRFFGLADGRRLLFPQTLVKENLLKQNINEIKDAPKIFYFSLSFIGIQGYPATVLRRWLLEKPDELDEMVATYLNKIAKEQEELETMDEDEDE